jgi:hypothetical protein
MTILSFPIHSICPNNSNFLRLSPIILLLAYFVLSSISSRGCSRLFIFFALYRSLIWCDDAIDKGWPISMPFKADLVESWLECAKIDCQSRSDDIQNLEKEFGGTKFDISVTSSYWSKCSQFLCWWKNNVERKSKLKSLTRDAAYKGSDERYLQRARYCATAIALSSSIRSRFDRHRNKLGGGIPHIPIPRELPESFQYTHISTTSPAPSFGSHWTDHFPVQTCASTVAVDTMDTTVESESNSSEDLEDELYQVVSPIPPPDEDWWSLHEFNCQDSSALYLSDDFLLHLAEDEIYPKKQRIGE